MRSLFLRFLVLLRQLFNLQADNANEIETVESIRRGVEFRGANLWILIFAIFIASIGLNMNSTAVVIGAMLISPLMGPIMGVGLGVGINDSDLIRKGFKNLAIAVGISVITSTIYFLVTPLRDARSELLSRTTPSVYDVLIAFFGGLAGIIASSRKEKSNAIPGVAIATALMPPLCTAGYGLATFQWTYFFGALYLFFINSVFITLSSFLIVRSLKYRRVEFMDKAKERKVRRFFWYVTVLTVLPSIYLAYRLVEQSIFENNANKFIKNELTLPSSFPISKTIDARDHHIEVVMAGDKVDDKFLAIARNKLDRYQLKGAKLDIRQSTGNTLNMEQVRNTVLQDLYQQNSQVVKDKDARIALLEGEVAKLKSEELPAEDILREMKSLDSNVVNLVLGKHILTTPGKKTDTLLLTYIKFAKKPTHDELQRLLKWLPARTRSSEVKVVTE